MALFYNYCSKPFTHTWGGIAYTFQPGQVYEGVIIANNGAAPLVLNDILAKFFARHLAEFVLNTPEMNINFTRSETGQAIPTDGFPMKYNTTSIDLLTERGITAPEVSVPMPKFAEELPILQTSGETLIVEKDALVEESQEAPKKRGRQAKVKEEESPSPTAEFDM